MPHALSDDQRHERVQYTKGIIKTVRRSKNFLNPIVAEDETWCFRCDPTTKRQSAEWKSPASPKGKKVRLQMTMLVCVYDNNGIIHHEFIPEGQSVTGIFYLSVLERLWKRNRRVRPEYSAPRQLVSSSRQCTGSPGSCFTRIFSPKTSVRAPSSALLP